jgi:hypothetical protein
MNLGEFGAKVFGLGVPLGEVALAMNLTKSALAHKLAGRRPVTEKDVQRLEELAATLVPSEFYVTVSGQGNQATHGMEATSSVAALRAATWLEGRRQRQ